MFEINWINFIHFYQPRFTDRGLFDEIVKSTYLPFCDFLEKNPDLKITINFTGCLTLSLSENGQEELITRYKKLLEKKQIELVDTLAFHPFSPALPAREIKKQIHTNRQINQDFFGSKYAPKGFFIPEMAYSKRMADIVKKEGYQYIILDEITSKKETNTQTKYRTSNGLNIIFRNRNISQTLVPESIINETKNKKQTIVTATDGELYGHQHKDWERTYQEAAQNQHIKTKTVSEYLKNLKETKKITLRNSTWESSEKELAQKNPYFLWQNPKNKIHTALWELAFFALKINNKNKKDPNHFASRLHLESGLSSCSWWWSSQKDLSHLFADPSWHPEMIEKGASELLSSVRSLEKISTKDKIKAEKMFSLLRKKIWLNHWQNK
jgi:predicted glycosyl hydrolase (DUF1957 family)